MSVEMNRPTLWQTYTYYRDQGAPPFPRTFATAVRGYHSGQTSLEPAMFHAGSADSIFQQPLNVRLVLDLMSNAETNHTVNQALSVVLFENLGNSDREVADFAAQSLARLEERYYGWIQSAEQRYEVAQAAATAQAAGAASPADKTLELELELLRAAEELAEFYFAFAELQSFNPMLRSYYLNKVLEIDSESCPKLPRASDGCLETQLPLLRIQALIELDRLDDAEREMRSTELDSTHEGIWLAAQIAYSRRDVADVRLFVSQATELERQYKLTPSKHQQLVSELWSQT